MKFVRPDHGKIEHISVQQTEELATIVEAGQDFSGKPFNTMVHAIAAKISDLVNYPYCSILLACPDKINLAIAGAYGLSSRYIDLVNQRYVIPRGNGPSGLAYSKGWSFAVDDVFKDPGFVKWRDVAAEAGYSSVISVPISTACQKLGSLTCYTPYKHVFSEQEMLWLLSIGRATGSAIQISTFVNSQNQALKRLEEINTLLKRQHELHIRNENISGALTRMVLACQSPRELLNYLANTLNSSLLYEDRNLNVIQIAHPSSSISGAGKTRTSIKTTQELVSNPRIKQLIEDMNYNLNPIELPDLDGAGLCRARIIFPIILGQDILGYLSIVQQGRQISDADLAIAKYGSSALAFSLIRGRTILEFKAKRKSHFLKVLMTNRGIAEKDLLEEAQEFGGTCLIPYRAMCIEVKSPITSGNTVSAGILSTVEDILTTHSPLSIAKKTDQRLSVLFPENEQDEPNTASTNVMRYLGDSMSRISGKAWILVGIGGRKQLLSDYYRSYWEAERVLDLLLVSEMSSKNNNPCIFGCFDTLGVASLLLQVQDPQEVQSFAKNVLKPIVEYDCKFKTNLLLTIKTFFDENCQNQNCAGKLNIHPNTLSYRLRKIEEICGKNISNLDDLMEIKLALKVIELYSFSQGEQG